MAASRPGKRNHEQTSSTWAYTMSKILGQELKLRCSGTNPLPQSGKASEIWAKPTTKNEPSLWMDVFDNLDLLDSITSSCRQNSRVCTAAHTSSRSTHNPYNPRSSLQVTLRLQTPSKWFTSQNSIGVVLIIARSGQFYRCSWGKFGAWHEKNVQNKDFAVQKWRTSSGYWIVKQNWRRGTSYQHCSVVPTTQQCGPEGTRRNQNEWTKASTASRHR